MESYFCNYCTTTIELVFERGAVAAIGTALNFLRHILSGRAQNPVCCRMHVLPYESSIRDDYLKRPGAPVAIRRSRAEPFNISAHCSTENNSFVFANENSAIVFPRSRHVSRTVTVYVSDRSNIQFIELIRDLITRFSESRGAVILHASAISQKRGLLVNAGEKGAGKTTIMLDMLRRLPNWRYFAGDKVFCSIRDGQIIGTSWRDWPYVGVGTLRNHPDLWNHVSRDIAPDLALRSSDDKILIDPDEFEAIIQSPFTLSSNRLTHVILPRRRADATATTVRVIKDLEQKWAAFCQIVERSADATYADWHSYIKPRYIRQTAVLNSMKPMLDDVHFFTLEGVIDSTALQLLELEGIVA